MDGVLDSWLPPVFPSMDRIVIDTEGRVVKLAARGGRFPAMCPHSYCAPSCLPCTMLRSGDAGRQGLCLQGGLTAHVPARIFRMRR
jgi:hypothetical protein